VSLFHQSNGCAPISSFPFRCLTESKFMFFPLPSPSPWQSARRRLGFFFDPFVFCSLFYGRAISPSFPDPTSSIAARRSDFIIFFAPRWRWDRLAVPAPLQFWSLVKCRRAWLSPFFFPSSAKQLFLGRSRAAVFCSRFFLFSPGASRAGVQISPTCTLFLIFFSHSPPSKQIAAYSFLLYVWRNYRVRRSISVPPPA